jgi:DNA modification methylase
MTKRKAAWPADKIERRNVEDLIPYARNARTHSDEQVAQIAASMKEWGWTNPVLIDEEGSIIAGHGRVLAARQLGITDVPCMVARGWTDAQKQAYRLADNQLAMQADWDNDLLKVELGELRELDFDLDLIGFDAPELNRLLTDEEEIARAEETPETPVNPVTVAGDVWLLGNHRIICGDATSATDVEKVLNGVKPHLMVTDPPYGVNYDANWRSSLDQWNQATGEVYNDNRDDWREAYALFPGDVCYLWHAGNKAHVAAESLEAVGFNIRAQIIWKKPHFVISRGDYHGGHEPCWYAVRKGRKSHWGGDRKQSTIWEISNALFQGKGGQHEADKNKTGHGTQKPIEAMRRPILNNSSPGQAVYDPFLGSGTTLIAAEMEGRHCYGLELHPPYVDVIIKRWQDYTGQQATHAETGQTFEQICEERFDSADNSKRCYNEAIDELRKDHERSNGKAKEQTRSPACPTG